MDQTKAQKSALLCVLPSARRNRGTVDTRARSPTSQSAVSLGRCDIADSEGMLVSAELSIAYPDATLPGPRIWVPSLLVHHHHPLQSSFTPMSTSGT
jgi:hypothetical protein